MLENKINYKYFLIVAVCCLLIPFMLINASAQTASPSPTATVTATASPTATAQAEQTSSASYGWLLDLGVLAFLALSAFYGIYKGFLVSIIHVASSVFSWVLAFAFYPLVSDFLAKNTNIINTLLYYTEGSSNINNVEMLNKAVSTMPKETVEKIVSDAHLPNPLGGLLQSNILNQVFSGSDVRTLAQYFDYTLANIMLNIISFILIFAVVKLIFFIVLRVANVISKLPVLKQCDKVLGAAAGVLRGIIVLYIVFSIVPIILTVVPNAMLTNTFNDSLFSFIFYKGNIISNIVSGIV